MMRATLTYAVLLAAALSLSWLEWTAEEEVDLEGRVVVLSGEVDDITSVRWSGDETEATITRRNDDRGAYLWVEYTRWTERKVASNADDTGDVSEPETERTAKHSVFKSAAKGEALLAKMSPLAAQRSLDVSDESKLEDLGLKTAKSRIEIDRAGSTEVLEIGTEAYGTRDYYARHQASGRIYLLDRELIQPLKYARTRLPDRGLYGMAKADLKEVTVSASGQAQTWVQRHADDKLKAHWALASDPETMAEQATTWLSKFMGLKGTQYADPEDPPQGLEERLQVTLTDGETTTTVAISQVGDDGDWYGQSEHTRGLIKLVRSGAGGLSDDVASLLGGADAGAAQP